MKPPQTPEWVREADGWYGLVVSADGSHIPFRQIPDYLKPMRELGTNYIQVWGQMTGGNNCDALPYPNPVLGTIGEFKAAIHHLLRVEPVLARGLWRRPVARQHAAIDAPADGADVGLERVARLRDPLVLRRVLGRHASLRRR